MVNKNYQIISWFTKEPEKVQEIAQDLLDSIKNDDEEDVPFDAKKFYEDVAIGKCHFEGRDGNGNWVWANYSRLSLQALFHYIRPFFVKVWNENYMTEAHTVVGINQDEMANKAMYYVLTSENKLNSWANTQVMWFYEELVRLPEPKQAFDPISEDDDIEIEYDFEF